ncbi:nitrate assimilation regulatory protein nirA [Purpureocillium lavendulum]|uniref:Nitrate assimilation regulatory protein nirA n=1 Tax=Purpureocillium lavendulum TaxID=1247861 RepID=A0AB34FCS0_9HYPO|nr:nitrate assimilation regulatory protein nirA [Purpureocillium lavendulum]
MNQRVTAESIRSQAASGSAPAAVGARPPTRLPPNDSNPPQDDGATTQNEIHTDGGFTFENLIYDPSIQAHGIQTGSQDHTFGDDTNPNQGYHQDLGTADLGQTDTYGSDPQAFSPSNALGSPEQVVTDTEWGVSQDEATPMALDMDYGGWLDEVLWVANTDDEDDLRLLEEIISSNPVRHKKLVIPGEKLSVYTYYKAWQRLERGKYYVKIDDDIVWVHDDAIRQLVTRKVLNPNEFVVSANVINNPPLGFLHYHFGAIHPYFPDLSDGNTLTESWRPSRYPFWNGSSDFVWPLRSGPPFHNHRWLRVEEDQMLSQTPAAQVKYEVWGESYRNWAIAAQMHYSLLENIEEDKLDLYTFDRPWMMDGERIRINFICVYSDDILDTDVGSWPSNRGDEDMIVVDLPKALRRRK